MCIRDRVSAPRGFAAGSNMGIRNGLFGVHDDGDTTGFGDIELQRQMPAESPRPYGSWFDEVVEILEELIEQSELEIAQVIERVVVDNDEPVSYTHLTRKPGKLWRGCSLLPDIGL